MVEKAMSRSAVYFGIEGLAFIIFGAVTLFWPGISLVALTALFGAFAFVYGALTLGTGLNLLAHRSTEWVPYVLGGLAGVVIGAVTFFRPGITAVALVYVIAVWAILVGVFEIVASVEARDLIKGAGWLAVSGVLSVAFGALVAFRPESGALAILWVIGVYAIIAGVSRLFAAYQLRRAQGEVKEATRAMQPQA